MRALRETLEEINAESERRYSRSYGDRDGA